MINKNFIFNTEDFILYILSQIPPEKSDKIRVNKLAFFIEFAYFFYYEKEISKTVYAAINNGPIINNYKQILEKMEKAGLIKINNYTILPLSKPKHRPHKEITDFIESIINRYKHLSNQELINLSHATDSYIITTKHEKKMGNIINKHYALLENFFDTIDDEPIPENKLPRFNKKNLVNYDI
jgi:uncharacterized phage-associated protein